MMMPSVFGESLFDDLMDFPFEKEFFGRRNPLYGKHADHIMKTDIKELDAVYEMDIDLPGFKKDEISLTLDNGYLVVGACKAVDEEDKDDKGKVLRKERYSGAMQRSFYVGEGLDEADVKAKFEDGVLSLTFPKEKEPELPEKKTIMIEG